MQDVLCATYHSSKPKMTQVDSQLPFQKPVGLLFPPNEGIPLPESNPTDQTMDLSGLGLSFPTIGTLKGLKFGLVTTIDEELIEGPLFGSALVGNAQGVYVANSDDGSSHMMAMTVKFVDGDFKDSLKFFGVHQTSLSESHIAIIGGTGKYHGANGYATVKAVTLGSNNEYGDIKKFLLFTIYLGY
ncbi:Dirigent protein [Thalictrum thalictroides]|uniref:Dirigent protein n=1 Tax=Thalictrum thalictroides TaxID=46969 RepID=A0A7J6XBR2_THATH|nr:Dirigent protein [Thalictrum thalictroides]